MQSWEVWVEVSAAERVQAFLRVRSSAKYFTQEVEEKQPCHWAVLLPALQIYNLCTVKCVRYWSCVRISNDGQNKIWSIIFLVSRKWWVLPLPSFCLHNCKWRWDNYPLWNLSPWSVNLIIFIFLKPGSWTVLGDPDCKLSHLSGIAQASTCTSTLIRPCFRRSETFSFIFFPQESVIVLRYLHSGPALQSLAPRQGSAGCAGAGLGRLPWPCLGRAVAGAGRCWQGCAGKPLPAISLAPWEVVTFLGGVPAHIFLSQIRAEACQEIHSEPAMLLLNVPAQKALLALLAPAPFPGLPPSPQLRARLPSRCPAPVPAAMLLVSSSPPPCPGPSCGTGGN